MIDPNIYVTIAATSLAGLGMVTFAGLAGWRGWLALKHQELVRSDASTVPTANTSARIEIADLRERVRKLEAIAAGVDL